MTSNKTVFFLIGILLIVLGFSMLAPYIEKPNTTSNTPIKKKTVLLLAIKNQII